MTCLLALLLAATLSGCATASGTDQKIAAAQARTDSKIEALSGQVEDLQDQARRLAVENDRLVAVAMEAQNRANEAGLLAKGKTVFEQSDVSSDIHFASNRVELSAEAISLIDDFARQLDEAGRQDYYLEIQGHSDTTEPNGDSLGTRRAAAVRLQLYRKYQIRVQRMSVISFGSTSPLASNADVDGRARNRRVSIVVLDGGDAAAFQTGRFALFPWPPPASSAREVIRPELLAPLSDAPATLGQVAAKLERALAALDYPQGSYFAVPGGFALVTRIERIKPDGAPEVDKRRWLSIDERVRADFSLTEYLRGLFQATPGYYRVIAFVVTPLTFSQSTVSVSPKQAGDWISAGANRLPPSVQAVKFNSAVSACTALIYEFERPAEDDPVTMKVPGRLTARAHLKKAGLLPWLEQNKGH